MRATWASTRGSTWANVPTAAGDRAGRDLGARRDQALFGAGELGIGDGELQPERGRLGMNAVGAADGRREFVFAGAALQRCVERFDVGDQKIGGAHQLHVEAGVEHVGRGHALVHEARLGADDFGQVGEEGDDVVLGLALDLVDARRYRTAPPCPSLQIFFAAAFGIMPSSAMASAAWASISNQMRNRVSGVQIAAICGRE